MIRRCTAADKSKWIELNRAFMRYEYEDVNAWQNPLSFGDLATDFDHAIKEDSGLQLFLVVDRPQNQSAEIVVGFINVQRVYSIWAHGYIFFVDDFFIAEQYRGCGYGRRAIAELYECAEGQNVKRIDLLSEDTNPRAVEFYKKIGFDQQIVNMNLKYIK